MGEGKRWELVCVWGGGGGGGRGVCDMVMPSNLIILACTYMYIQIFHITRTAYKLFKHCVSVHTRATSMCICM